MARLLDQLVFPISIKLKVELDLPCEGLMSIFATFKHVFDQIINLNILVPSILQLHEICVSFGIVLAQYRDRRLSLISLKRSLCE